MRTMEAGGSDRHNVLFIIRKNELIFENLIVSMSIARSQSNSIELESKIKLDLIPR